MLPTGKRNRSKGDAETFARLTGWEGRTNEHARGAGRLVFGFSAGEVTLAGGYLTLPAQRIRAGTLARRTGPGRA